MDEKNLLERSRDILAYEDELALRYEGYYERPGGPATASPRTSGRSCADDVIREAETLKEAAAQLRQAHQWAADRADELTTRLREGQESSSAAASSAAPPPTPSSTWRRSGRTASPPASISTRWP